MVSESARYEHVMREQEVIRSLYGLVQAYDDRDFDRWLGWFTPDAVIEVRPPNAAPSVYTGDDQLQGWVARLRESSGAGWHGDIAPLVSFVDAETASAKSSFFGLTDAGSGVPVVVAFGRYEDELVRSPDGIWRFRHRTSHIRSVQGAAATLVTS
jgi:hypothetical protein